MRRHTDTDAGGANGGQGAPVCSGDPERVAAPVTERGLAGWRAGRRDGVAVWLRPWPPRPVAENRMDKGFGRSFAAFPLLATVGSGIA